MAQVMTSDEPNPAKSDDLVASKRIKTNPSSSSSSSYAASSSPASSCTSSPIPLSLFQTSFPKCRETESTLLLDMIYHGSKGTTIILHGEPGIGKTLVSRFVLNALQTHCSQTVVSEYVSFISADDRKQRKAEKKLETRKRIVVLDDVLHEEKIKMNKLFKRYDSVDVFVLVVNHVLHSLSVSTSGNRLKPTYVPMKPYTPLQLVHIYQSVSKHAIGQQMLHFISKFHAHGDYRRFSAECNAHHHQTLEEWLDWKSQQNADSLKLKTIHHLPTITKTVLGLFVVWVHLTPIRQDHKTFGDYFEQQCRHLLQTTPVILKETMDLLHQTGLVDDKHFSTSVSVSDFLFYLETSETSIIMKDFLLQNLKSKPLKSSKRSLI